MCGGTYELPDGWDVEEQPGEVGYDALLPGQAGNRIMGSDGEGGDEVVLHECAPKSS